MNLLHSLLFAYQVLVLWYFALLNLLYALFALFGIRMVARYARELSELALKDLLEREAYLPVSILVPTYNEEKTIAASVRSFLALHYPEFEVIVVADGPRTAPWKCSRRPSTWCRWRRPFAGWSPPSPSGGSIAPSATPTSWWWTRRTGARPTPKRRLNLARYPLFCAVDADSLLDAQALLRASRLFLEDDRVLAVGGTIRP